jgi:hypothetical protein
MKAFKLMLMQPTSVSTNHFFLTKTARLFRMWFVIALVSLTFSDCSEIRLIGAYDQAVDQNIQKISKDVATLLVEVEKNVVDNRAAENQYESFRPRYTSIEGDIAALKLRAGALPKYDKIKQQVDLVDQNIRNLEALHKSNFSAPGKSPLEVVQTVRTLFDISFTAMLTLQNGLKREKAGKPKLK